MKNVIVALSFLLFSTWLVPAAAHAQAPAVSASGDLVLLGSADSTGSVSLDRLNACTLHLAEEMKITDKEMPHIVILRISPLVAGELGLKESTVRRIVRVPVSPPDGVVLKESDAPKPAAHGEPQVYYELWLVGPVGDPQYAAGIQHVLETHFNLDLPQGERIRILGHVVGAMSDAPAGAEDSGRAVARP